VFPPVSMHAYTPFNDLFLFESTALVHIYQPFTRIAGYSGNTLYSTTFLFCDLTFTSVFFSSFTIRRYKIFILRFRFGYRNAALQNLNSGTSSLLNHKLACFTGARQAVHA
jgi:hypothetical protein